MKAAVLREIDAPLEIEDVELDDPGPGEVRVKIAATGVCHSDLHILEGHIPNALPCVLGHEPAGIVEAVGEGVDTFSPGDHVIGCLNQWCGVCRFCTEGRPNLCVTQFSGRPQDAPPRITGKGGVIHQFANLSSFAEAMLCNERSLVKIRDDVPLDRACLVGCGVTTGLGAAMRTVSIPAGASVAVVGCGGVGLSVLQGARIVGAGQIIAVDAQPWKFDLARQLGATDVVNAKDDDAVAAVKDLTGGGAQFVFECIGLKPTVEQAVKMTGRGGTTVLVGVVPMGTMIEIHAIETVLQEKKLVGSFMGSNRFRFDMPQYLEFYRDGRLRLDEMISSRIKLDEINASFDQLRKGESARAVVVFD